MNLYELLGYVTNKLYSVSSKTNMGYYALIKPPSAAPSPPASSGQFTPIVMFF